MGGENRGSGGSGRALTLATALAAALTLATPHGERAEAAKLPAGERASDARYVAGEILVRYREGVAASQRASARAAVNSHGTESLPVPRLEVVELAPGSSVPGSVRRLERRPEVLYAEPNYVRRFHGIPNDPLFSRLWGLHNTGAGGAVPDADIDAPAAWDVTTGDPGVVVALLDSGVNYNHPDLAPNIWANPGETGAGRETNGIDDDGNGFVDDHRGWDFGFGDETPGNDNDPMDNLGHGTHTGGTIAAAGDNGIGIIGVGPETTLMPVKVGDFDLSVATSIRGIRYADLMGADIVNMSYGGWPRSQAEQDAIRAADETLFAISAGNFGSDLDRRSIYPCDYSAKNIVCVAASTDRDRLAGFSNYGSRSVDLAAPGHRILSTAWRPIPQAVFRDDFDGRLRPRWKSSGPRDQWGIERHRRRIPIPPEILPEPIYVERRALSDSPDGRYRNNANASIRSPAIRLSGDLGCAATYAISGKLERGYDRLHVEGWDGSAWQPLTRYSGRISRGKSSVALDAFTGDPGFRLRFRLESDASGREDGVEISDLVVSCRTRYWRLSGTSMAAPHVAGAASLLAAEFPGASPLELRARLLAGVDRRRAFRGALASGGRLNVYRSLTQEDSHPPQTTITAVERFGRRARLRLSSSEPLSRFRCKLDTGAWAPCRPLHKTAPLSPGPHILRAAAVDYFGNQDPTPALRRFRIDH
jgi:subtilisin family serine protease